MKNREDFNSFNLWLLFMVHYRPHIVDGQLLISPWFKFKF